MDTDPGSYTSVYCVASPDFKAEYSGAYFERIAKVHGWSSSNSKKMDLAEKLETYTEELMTSGGWAPAA